MSLEHTKTKGVRRRRHASTAVRGERDSERTATHADRESAGLWANATSGTVCFSPNRKLLRSKSERYPHSRSEALREAGVSKLASTLSGSKARSGASLRGGAVLALKFAPGEEGVSFTGSQEARSRRESYPLWRSRQLTLRHMARPEVPFRNFSIAASRNQLLRDTGTSL